MFLHYDGEADSGNSACIPSRCAKRGREEGCVLGPKTIVDV